MDFSSRREGDRSGIGKTDNLSDNANIQNRTCPRSPPQAAAAASVVAPVCET